MQYTGKYPISQRLHLHTKIMRTVCIGITISIQLKDINIKDWKLHDYY